MELVCIRFDMIVGIIEPGDGIQAWAFAVAVGYDIVCYANNRRGVHAAAEFGENRAIRTKSALDSFGEKGAELLFVFGVFVIADCFTWIEVPILADSVPGAVFTEPHMDRRRWCHGKNP